MKGRLMASRSGSGALVAGVVAMTGSSVFRAVRAFSSSLREVTVGSGMVTGACAGSGAISGKPEDLERANRRGLSSASNMVPKEGGR